MATFKEKIKSRSELVKEVAYTYKVDETYVRRILRSSEDRLPTRGKGKLIKEYLESKTNNYG